MLPPGPARLVRQRHELIDLLHMAHKGVMARPGMTDDDGEPVGRLEGPLRWAVDLDGAVKIDGPLPLPEDA